MNIDTSKIIKYISDKNNFVSRYGILFLCVLAIFTIAFGVLLHCANREFCNSQERIKQTYVEHIQIADSLYRDMVDYNKEYTSCICDVNTAILTDSLFRLTLGEKQKMSMEQYSRLHHLITIHFSEIAKLHEKYDTKIQRDSILLLAERQLLENQVKTMLDLHLNKVEHEYSNITLWAAVLTILFLVFSFYSIFKMDSLVQQGNEGVREIRRLMESGENAIQSVNEKVNVLINDSEERINALKKDANSELASFINAQQRIVSDTIAEVQKELNETILSAEQTKNNVASSIETINRVREESIALLNEKLSSIEKQYNKAIQTKVNELNSYIDRLLSLMADWEQNTTTRNQNGEDRKEDGDV